MKISKKLLGFFIVFLWGEGFMPHAIFVLDKI